VRAARPPNKHSPEQASRRPWTAEACCRFPGPACWPGTIQALSQQAPLRTSPGSRGSALAPPHKPSSPPFKQPKALDCCEPSQLSGRTECARPALRTRHLRPSHSNFSLPTSHFPLPPLRTSRSPNTPWDREAPHSPHPTSNRPLRSSSRRLWTAVSHHSSQGARSARGPPSEHAPLRPRPPPNKPGIARLRTRPTPQALVPSEPASRRLWTAGRITALGAHGVRAARPPNTPPSDQARDREAPHSPHPTSPRPLRPSQPKALDCGSLLPLSRSQPAGPLSVLATSDQAIQTSHFSLLTSHFSLPAPSPNQPFPLPTSHFSLLTSFPSPQAHLYYSLFSISNFPSHFSRSRTRTCQSLSRNRPNTPHVRPRPWTRRISRYSAASSGGCFKLRRASRKIPIISAW
jgi:hypothetical protein